MVALILLTVLTLIGVIAARMQTVEERLAMNDNNHQLALQNGEAVLRHVETQFADGVLPSTLTQVANEVTDGGSAYPYQSVADQPAATFTTQSQPYTGPALGSVPVQAPQYALESMPPGAFPSDKLCGSGYGSADGCSIDRTTTLAGGADAASVVTVQSLAH